MNPPFFLLAVRIDVTVTSGTYKRGGKQDTPKAVAENFITQAILSPESARGDGVFLVASYRFRDVREKLFSSFGERSIPVFVVYTGRF